MYFYFRFGNPGSSKAMEEGSGRSSVRKDWQHESLP